VFKSPLLKEIVWLLARNSHLMSAENFWFLIFCAHMIISSDEMQSKAQLNTLSLGENKTGYRAENIFFPQMKTSRKVHICLQWFSYRTAAMQSNASSLPSCITFMLCSACKRKCFLLNFASNLVKRNRKPCLWFLIKIPTLQWRVVHSTLKSAPTAMVSYL